MSEVFARSRQPTADDSYTSSPCSSFGEGKGSSQGLGGFRELPANLAAAVCDIRCSGFERHRLCVSCMCLLMMAKERRVQKSGEGNEQEYGSDSEGSEWQDATDEQLQHGNEELQRWLALSNSWCKLWFETLV